MAETFSLEGSLPDQLAIVEKSSTHSEEHLIHHVLPKVEIRKSKKLKTVLKPKKAILSRYFTAGVQINAENIRDLKKEIPPFRYPKDIEEFAHKVLGNSWRNDKRIEELQKKVFNRPSHKDRQKRDLLNRLYVKSPCLKDEKSVLSIDNNYYSIVSGRPIADKLEIRKYIQIVRESLRTKIVTGYREDDLMLIEETMKLEQKMIDTIKKNLQDYINAFEEFLITDHRSAMKLLQESEELSTLAYERYSENKTIAKKYAFLRTSLYNVEDKWKLCRMYIKFLYNMSPLTWRMEQEQGDNKDRRTSSYMMEQQPGDMLDIFGKNRATLAEKGISLEDLINQFKEEISDVRPPRLYFTEPEQLLEVFKFMEMQNLHSLLHSEELATPLAHIKEGMVTVVYLFDKQILKLEDIIEKLEGGISWEEKRVKFLEELASNLIKTELRNLLMDERIINLHVFVEDAYEASIGPNDTNLSIGDMMKAIEEKYRYELLFLDKVPSSQVEFLEGNFYQEETLIMKLAERAAKQFAELERFTINMKSAYTPPPKKSRRKLKWRSPPKKDPVAVKEPPRYLTADEEEFLEFFTNFCKNTDNPEDFGINLVN